MSAHSFAATARRVALGALTMMVAVGPLLAQPSDTSKVSKRPLFGRRDVFVAGAFVIGTVAMFPADREVAKRIRRDSAHVNNTLDDLDSFFRWMGTPGAMIIGTSMFAVGKVAKVPRMADLGLHGTESLIIASLSVGLAKNIAGRRRPFVDITDPTSFVIGRGLKDDQYRSFPSGHTGQAFAAAAAVTAETARWWPNSKWVIGPAMFGGAALVGASRMYDNKHWASDVVMGAALGTFSGLKVVRYHHSHPHNRIDRWLLGAAPVPTSDGGVMLAWRAEF